MAKFYDYNDVMSSANGGWPSILGQLGVDASSLTGKHTACPGCKGKDRFRFDDRDGDGTFICSQGGGGNLSGDGVALIAHVKDIEWKDAVNLVGEHLGVNCKEYEPKSAGTGVAAAPQAQKQKVNDLYDENALRELVAGVQDVTPEWFIERSPVDPRKVLPGEFLNTIFDKGERAMVFTSFFSQGEFGWECGRGGFRLAEQPGVQAVKSALPMNGGKDGVWFLSNPVSLKWENNPRNKGQKSRRIKECVTDWKYLVLESDDAPDELWLKFLAMFPDPIRAIYSSGGKSWHALVAVHADTWAAMDGILKGDPKAKTQGRRMGAKALWARHGADPGALTPVRLTRLPGCTRNGKEQRLIYLNPHHRAQFAEDGRWVKKRIVDLVPVRNI